MIARRLTGLCTGALFLAILGRPAVIHGEGTNGPFVARQEYEAGTARWDDVISDIKLIDSANKYGWPNEWPQRGDAEDEPADSIRIPELLRVAALPSPRDMMRIPGGPFVMGTQRLGVTNLLFEVPMHRVSVQTIFMDRYEVSRQMWGVVRVWAASHMYSDLPTDVSEDSEENARLSNHPMICVAWYDCLKWCNARSEKEGLVPVYYTDIAQTGVYRTGVVDMAAISADWSADGYRLPTEAEWEKAARGGIAGKDFPWGNTLDGSMANYLKSGDPYDDGTTPVGYYNGRQIIKGKRQGGDMANSYGLFDMAGNVSEWCWDRYAPVDVSVVDNPRGADAGAYRVTRGGSWKSAVPARLFVSFRGTANPAMRTDHIGFRCVKRE